MVRPVVHPVCPLVPFALFAGGGGMLVAAEFVIMLYIDDNEYGEMEGRTVVCRISVIREQRLAHFSPILGDGNFPTRIIS